MAKLYQITTQYACAGVEVDNGIICNAAPIFKWMIGKPLNFVIKWVTAKEGTVVEV